MSLWFRSFELADLDRLGENTLVDLLGIRFTGFDEHSLTAAMPVEPRTRQPYGLLHGGASAALAETLGSVAAMLCVDPAQFRCVGQTLTASHVSSARDGEVIGTARSVHRGGRSQVWQIDIRKPDQSLVCLASLTVAVLAIR